MYLELHALDEINEKKRHCTKRSRGSKRANWNQSEQIKREDKLRIVALLIIFRKHFNYSDCALVFAPCISANWLGGLQTWIASLDECGLHRLNDDNTTSCFWWSYICECSLCRTHNVQYFRTCNIYTRFCFCACYVYTGLSFLSLCSLLITCHGSWGLTAWSYFSTRSADKRFHAQS